MSKLRLSAVLASLLLRQLRHVVVRALQAVLFAAPERERDLVRPASTWSWRAGSRRSRIAAVPDPLSLIPGPSPTESRCAPTTTCFVGSPFLLVASTLNVSTVTVVVCERRRRRSGRPRSRAPHRSSKLVPTTGMSSRSRRAFRKRRRSRSSPGTTLPWLKMTTPDAPAASRSRPSTAKRAGSALDAARCRRP